MTAVPLGSIFLPPMINALPQHCLLLQKKVVNRPLSHSYSAQADKKSTHYEEKMGKVPKNM